MRIRLLRREAAMYVILRRKNYSINMLADFFGRSTNMIHKILKANNLTGYRISGSGFAMWKVLHQCDMRKSRPQRFKYSAKVMDFIRQKWLDWICGDGEEPP